jgi:hypothetical protein
MANEKEELLIAQHMRDYGVLIHAEAEKMELLGIATNPDLFEKARMIHFLSEQIGKRIKVLVTAE